MEIDTPVLYRCAYGLAAGLAREGKSLETIVEEIAYLFRIRNQPARAVGRDAAEDVLAGRRPRW